MFRTRVSECSFAALAVLQLVVPLHSFSYFVFSPAQANPMCNPATGICYHVYDPYGTWEDCRDWCDSQGLWMLTLHTQELHDWYKANVGTEVGETWLGLNDGAVEGTFNWYGTNIPFTWSLSGMVNTGDKDCVIQDTRRKWISTDCSDHWHYYVCQTAVVQTTVDPAGQITVQTTASPTSQTTAQTTTSQTTVQTTTRATSQTTAQTTTRPTSQTTVHTTARPTSQTTGQTMAQTPAQTTDRPTTKTTVQTTARPTSQTTAQTTARPTSQTTVTPTSQPSPYVKTGHYVRTGRDQVVSTMSARGECIVARSAMDCAAFCNLSEHAFKSFEFDAINGDCCLIVSNTYTTIISNAGTDIWQLK